VCPYHARSVFTSTPAARGRVPEGVPQALAQSGERGDQVQIALDFAPRIVGHLAHDGRDLLGFQVHDPWDSGVWWPFGGRRPILAVERLAAERPSPHGYAVCG
jgi:hypothetical protein